MTGLTTIILPTYNRATFLPEAIKSIRAQQNSHWELVVVDDGSTDETAAIVSELCRDFAERVRYVRQDNRGAYAARVVGLGLANGDYIAFFDSDDLWLPHHLERCVSALAAYPDLDWIYGACQMVNFRTGETLDPSTFYEHGRPKPFMRLNADRRGSCQRINDPAIVTCAIRYGLYCGLQNSVIRRRVFDERVFAAAFRNEAVGDQLFAIRAALAGYGFAYIDDIHVVYRVHEANSSAAGIDMAFEKRLMISLDLARGYEELLADATLAPAQARAVKQRLNREYFWHAGYALLWQHGQRRDALEMFTRGIRVWPWNLACWKTYILALIRVQMPSGQVSK